MISYANLYQHLPVALLGLTLSLALPSQEKPAPVKTPDVEMGEEDEKRAARTAEMEEQERLEWASMTPEERLERRTKRGSKAYCRFVATCRPEKLLPGQSGTLLVTALLQGQAVLPSPARIEIMSRPTAAPVDLGGLMIRPAEPGKLATAYIGQPVYENFAVFEVPVAMSPEAKLGEKVLVSFDLKFDLYDGSSAQPIGRFIERVATEVGVGKALDPAVAGGVRSRPAPPEPITTTAESGDAVDTAAPPAGPPASGDALSGSPVAPAVASDVTAPPPPSSVVPASGEGGLPPPTSDALDLPLPLFLGGGAILLVIVLLLARKR